MSARDDLLRLMHEISEDDYCAGWLCGLEYTLWSALTGDGLYPYGAPSEVQPHDVAGLAMLSRKADGWFIWSEKQIPAVSAHDGSAITLDEGETFVPMAEWLPMYAARIAQIGAKP